MIYTKYILDNNKSYIDVHITNDYEIRMYYYYFSNKMFSGTICGFIKSDNTHILRSKKKYSNEKILLLSSFFVNNEYRRKGIGSILLKCMIDVARKHNIKKILLDDMSDNYRLHNNIYITHGFYYVHDDGPEMEYIL